MKALNQYPKKTKTTICIVSILLLIAIILAIAIPLALKNTSRVISTEYDLVKTTKMNNFTFLNQTAEHNQVVLIGDSITEIYNSSDLFIPYTKSTGRFVLNRGISGDTSDRLLERLESNALNITPSHLVILIGTNDIAKGIDISVIENNIASIISLTKEKSPNTKIILQAIYPVNYSISRSMVGSRKNSVIINLNKNLALLAEKEKITWLDLTEHLSDAEGNLLADYTYDGLHPNAAGFNAITEKLLPHLN